MAWGRRRLLRKRRFCGTFLGVAFSIKRKFYKTSEQWSHSGRRSLPHSPKTANTKGVRINKSTSFDRVSWRQSRNFHRKKTFTRKYQKSITFHSQLPFNWTSGLAFRIQNNCAKLSKVSERPKIDRFWPREIFGWFFYPEKKRDKKGTSRVCEDKTTSGNCLERKLCGIGNLLQWDELVAVLASNAFHCCKFFCLTKSLFHPKIANKSRRDLNRCPRWVLLIPFNVILETFNSTNSWGVVV